MGFLKQVRPWHLGLLFVHMWIYCATHRPAATDEVSVMVVMYAVLSAALVAVFCAVRAAVRRGMPLAQVPSHKLALGLDVAAACALAVAGGLLAAPAVLSPLGSVVVASVLGGLGVAWAYMRWGQFYAQLDIHYAAPLVFLTMVVGSAGKTLVDFLPAAPAAAVLTAIPFLLFVCLRRSLATVPPAAEPICYYNARTVGSLWRLAAGIAVYSLTVGVIQSVFLEAMPSPYHASVLVHHGSEILLALAMLLWVTVARRGLDFSRTWRLILILMATALIFEPYLDPAFLSYLLSLVRTAQTFLIVFLFLALADVARHSQYHPMVVFSLGRVAYSLPFAVGKGAGDELAALGSGASLVMAAIMWVLVVVTLFVLDEASLGNRLVFTELNDGGDDDTPAKRMGAIQQALNEQDDANRLQADVLSLRCSALAGSYGLTPREREILELLARGRSKTHIAEAFLISENTVRGHVKHIYAKLDVHGKQELVDKLESVEV